MKILAINSSGRKKGNTAKVILLMKKYFEELSKNYEIEANFEILHLSDYYIDHCKGCRVCMDIDEKKCSIQDDFLIVKEKMDEADGIIFGSPVYVGDLNSAMKALLDRLAYLCHRQEYYDKCFSIISTTHSSSRKRAINSIAGSILSWGGYLASKGGFRILNTYSLEDIEKFYGKKIKKILSKQFVAIKMKAYLNPSILSLMIFKIQQNTKGVPESGVVDYNYWHNNKWTDSNVSYYLKPNVGRIKIVSAYILYKIINRIFIKTN